MIYVKDKSTRTNRTYLSHIPKGCMLNPPADSEGQIELTKEKFDKTKKEYIGDFILNGIRCQLYEEVN